MKRDERIELRANQEVKAILEKAALLQHKTLSAYLIESALKKARKEIRETEIITLNNNDRDRFFEALQNPPAPNKNLINLFSEE